MIGLFLYEAAYIETESLFEPVQECSDEWLEDVILLMLLEEEVSPKEW